MASSEEQKARWATALAVCAVGLASLWLRLPGLASSGFASHDVAGITYNAQLLLAGDLPYRESIELKAPGTFYLAALLAPAADVAGHGVRWVQRLHFVANLWSLATLLVVAGVAWRVFGRRAAVLAASLFALHDAHLDSMDANYVTWANLPIALALGLGLEARGTTSCAPVERKRHWPWWMAAGAAAGVAALCKRPAAAIGPALLFMVLWPRASDDRSWRARFVDAGALALGVALAHLPITVHYASQGALGDLVRGYGLNRWGAAYVGAREVGLAAGLKEGVLSSAYFVGLPLALAAFAALASTFPVRRQGPLATASLRAQRDLARSLAVASLCLLAATAVGFRFYKGYFSSALAPLCILAASPAGIMGVVEAASRSAGARWRVRALAGVLVLATAAGAWRQAQFSLATRSDRARPHDAGARAIVAMIRPELDPGDRVWVWGWHLWDVYTYAGALSGSRIYKSLGLLTPPNDDTWRTPASKPRFVDGPMARLLVRELAASRPRWIVLGSTAPVREFAALRALLDAHYVRDRSKRLGRVQFWRRR